MNTVQHVSISKAGAEVFKFVCHDDAARANYIAGMVIDALSDYHGGDDWNYKVEAVPYVAAMTSVMDIVHMATDKVSF